MALGRPLTHTRGMTVTPRLRRRALLLSLAVLPLVAGCPFGPRDLDRYPAPGTSPYVLPWAEGMSHLCVQGNNGLASHHGSSAFSYDFLMPSGTAVLAARAGVVVAVKEDSDRVGRGEWNNYVRIRHEDGSVASYLHLQQDGALVEVGQRVAQRELIARSGWTGYAALPHLHFHVRDGGRQVPVSFRDVPGDRGVPRSWGVYTAGRP